LVEIGQVVKEEKIFEAIVDDARRTLHDARRQTLESAPSQYLTWHNVPGELKTFYYLPPYHAPAAVVGSICSLTLQDGWRNYCLQQYITIQLYDCDVIWENTAFGETKRTALIRRHAFCTGCTG